MLAARWLVYYSRYTAWRAGLGSSATFARADLWQTDMAQYNTVVIFGVEQMMAELQSKLERELRPGSSVVACRFPFKVSVGPDMLITPYYT